jgi:beta-lactamase superfamily II metal-dependent hydrolase
MNRREFLQASGGLAALGVASRSLSALAAEDVAGSPLTPWHVGVLDIHHINTGRGNSALVVMPDGTSLLVDAGAAGTQGPAMCAAKPDESRSSGEWIARYAQRRLVSTRREGLDYAVLTHLHGDHIGDVTPQSPKSAHGDYKTTGISDVAEAIPIRTLIDRGYPSYDYPAKFTGQAADAAALNYIAFVKARTAQGLKTEQARVGSGTQITPLNEPARFPAFDVRILARNGSVWTGKGESSVSRFPAQLGDGANAHSDENGCSIALRLRYGKFAYFIGGDLHCDTNFGRDPWRDVETAAGEAAGRVSVSTCNHHGYFDATGPGFVRAVQPRVWILQSWHASHPALSTLANIYSPLLYPGPRDVFCLSLHPAAALACGRFSDQFKSSQGHVVVRVAPGGAEYSVLVLEDGDESDKVKAVFGPYTS